MKRRPTLLLKNVSIPGGRSADILMEGTTIRHVGAGSDADQVIDCSQLLVVPAAVDLHVHMRGGPQAAKEDWESGSRSAIAGGVTVVADQPNTIPALTTPEAFAARVADAKAHSLCSFAINSGVTAATPLAAMWEAGASAFGETFFAPSSYGDAVDATTLTRALAEIGRLGAVATIHAEEVAPGEDSSLVDHARIRSAAGEVRAVEAVSSCNTTGCRIYFCHMSSSRSVAVAKGIVEVTPHHLFLSHETFDPLDTLGKMNPPLRTEKERKDLYAAWDRIDIIASDHAPHTRDEKSAGFAAAPSGVPGVETLLPLLLAEVVAKRISLADVIAKTSQNPSRILGIEPAGFEPGCRADFVLCPRKETTITAENLHSRCGWTPFEGMKGVFPTRVIMGGQVVYEDGEFRKGDPAWIPGKGYRPGRK
ncbi:MAG: dihydroorotase [Methanomicrobiales archaeon]|nr:dihydroorotase [Methanomicrobiales archaeon]